MELKFQHTQPAYSPPDDGPSVWSVEPPDYITLQAGYKRIVHVLASALKENREKGINGPVVAVRDAANPADAKLFDKVIINGPSELSYTPDDPMPGTSGNGVCVLRTDASLICFGSGDRIVS